MRKLWFRLIPNAWVLVTVSETELSPRGQRTHDRLVEAAVEVFAAHGRDATTITAVADRCGITPPAVYRYFADKDALYRAALDAAEAAYQAEVAERVQGVPFPFLRGEYNRAVAATLPNHPLIRRVWTEARPDDMAWLSSSDLAHARRRLFAAELARGQELGVVRRELDATALASSADHLGIALRPFIAADDPRPETWAHLEYVIVAAVFDLPADYSEPGARERFFARVNATLLEALHG